MIIVITFWCQTH